MLLPAVKSIAEFLAWCRAHPREASYGTPSAGSTAHLGGVLLARKAQVDLQPVNYRGPTPAVSDMLGGSIAAVITPLGDVKPAVDAGRCRIIATSGSKRSRFVPDVPTFAEQGIRDMVVEATFGFFLRSGCTPAQVQRASEFVRRALAAPDVQQSLEIGCMEAAGSTPAAYRTHLADESRRWSALVRATGFSTES